jgi:hypothetical protein
MFYNARQVLNTRTTRKTTREENKGRGYAPLPDPHGGAVRGVGGHFFEVDGEVGRGRLAGQDVDVGGRAPGASTYLKSAAGTAHALPPVQQLNCGEARCALAPAQAAGWDGPGGWWASHGSHSQMRAPDAGIMRMGRGGRLPVRRPPVST